MYIGIFKIIFDRKIHMKLDAFVNLLKRCGMKRYSKSIVFALYFVIKGILAIAGGLGLCLLISEEYLSVAIGLIFIGNAFFKFVDGCVEYKNTFIFPFGGLAELSVATEKRLYRTQLLVVLIQSVFLDEGLLASVIFLTVEVLLNGISVFVLINFLLVILLAFLLGNILAGRYTYAIVVRKVSLIRLLVYIIWTAVLVFVTAGITYGMIRLVRDEFLNKLTDINMLLDDTYVKSVFEGYGDGIVDFFFHIGVKIALLAEWGAHPAVGLLSVGLMGVLLLPRIRLIPIHKENKNFSGRDIYMIYRDFLKRILRGNILVRNQMEEFQKYRWLFVKSFFQIAVLQYEAVCYIAILTVFILNTNNHVLILQLLICMNLLVSAIQASELRNTGYLFFCLSTEVQHMKLVKSSLADKDVIWKAKEKVFRSLLLFSWLVVLVVNAGICIYTGLPLSFMIISVGVLLLGAFIMPRIQLHMMPIVTNVEYLSDAQVGENFVEEEVAEKMQEFPRIFLVVVPMLLTIVMLVVAKSRNVLFVGCELAYLILSASILYGYMKKIRDKGVENTVKKVC